MPDKMSEVERKWRLEHVPLVVTSLREMLIEQAYLVADPGELRIRRSLEGCFITVKGDGTIARPEWEKAIPEWVFEQLFPTTELALFKMRYTIAGAPPLYVDIFSGCLTGLILVEAEWVGVDALQEQMEAAANAFELPADLGPAQEVTNDPQYKNKRLAALKGLDELSVDLSTVRS